MKPLVSFFLASALFAPSFARATFENYPNYLLNPGFEDWSQGFYGDSITGLTHGATGADDWLLDNFYYGTTSDERVKPPAGLDNPGNYSIEVSADTAGNGIGQGTTSSGDSPVTIRSVSGWVYLVSGSVDIDYYDYNQKALVTVDSTSVLNQWVFLGANTEYAGGFANSMGMYILAASTNTTFYADNMDEDADYLPTPEPASLLGLGLGALALLRRKRGRA